MNGGETTSSPLVLLVDDNQDHLEIHRAILSAAGYRVAVAADGRTGLELVRRLRPDVVVLDMMMPDMDGLAFLDALPSGPQPPPPVIANSGFERFEPHARARGARVFLRKPTPPEDLLSAIARVLAGREEPDREPAQAARILAGRERANQAREQLWARIDLDDPELRAMSEGVLAWLSAYHGFGTGLVDLLRGGRILVEAGRSAGISVDRELAFCSDVIDAGSSLVISDATVHPIFAGHKAQIFWGTRFYAGCPITTRSGLVLGTVCLIDGAPHRFSVGDMRVLEYLARRFSEHLQALAEGHRPAPFFEPPALFTRGAIEVVLSALLADRRDVALVLATSGRSRADPTLFGRVAGALRDSVIGERFAAVRWSSETMAFVCLQEATERALSALRGTDLAPDAIGAVEYRSTPAQRTSAGDVIANAEAARELSAAAGGSLVRTVMPCRDASGPAAA